MQKIRSRISLKDTGRPWLAWSRIMAALVMAFMLVSGSGAELEAPEPAFPEPDVSSLEGISLIAGALAWLGTPYQLGGFSRTGVDCSGFIHNVLNAAVPEMGPFPRQSSGYATFGLGATTIEPGDILLFAQEEVIYHVGLALSESSFIHSASEGARTGVIISSMSEGGWSARLYGIRKLNR